MTYLQLINEVLERLREATVATINQNTYSTLIGHYINDAKRQVEDAWQWEALDTTATVTTVAGTSQYLVTGSGTKQKNVTANITTTGKQTRLLNVAPKWLQDQQQLTTITNSTPGYFAWDGNNGTDSYVQLLPTPDATYTLKFNMSVPQAKLTSGADVLLVPYEAVVAGAYARAIAERGEDGGLASSEAYGLYKGILADAIAVESTRDISNDCWVVT